jgi:type I restriction enzyme S subunit
MQAWNGMFGISPLAGITSPDYATYEFLVKVEPRFIEYTLRTELYAGEFSCRSRGMGTGFLRLNPGEFLSTPLWLPDVETQEAIADFLDRETVRIDQLIGKKERLLELLGDKLVALIEVLVTGRNRSDFQSDAGRSSFVKGMPKGWIETRVRFGISKIEQGWSPQCEDRLISNDEWGVLKLGAITTGVFREAAHKALPSDLAPRPEYTVRPGDVLIARASGSPAMVGKACYVDAISRNLMISDKHYRIYLSNARFMPEFFYT